MVFSHGTASTRGVYRADVRPVAGDVSLSELMVAEDGFIDLPGFSNPLDYSINDSGFVAMVLRRLDFTRGIYVTPPNGSLNPIVEEGDPAPGGGNFTSNLAAPSVNAANRIAFSGDFGTGSGIFIATPRGRITKVIDSSAEVPNHPGTFFDRFGNIHLADDMTIIFTGRYRLNGFEFQGIYKKSSAGLEVIFDQFDGLVVDGQHVSLINTQFGGRALDMFLAPRFANVGDDITRVAFLQRLPLQRSGIFIASLR
jgi:hypothetical protein